MVEWALTALGLWGSSPTARLYQQVAGLTLEVATIKGERDEVDRQRDRLSNRVDKLVDALADIRRRCDLEET